MQRKPEHMLVSSSMFGILKPSTWQQTQLSFPLTSTPSEGAPHILKVLRPQPWHCGEEITGLQFLRTSGRIFTARFGLHIRQRSEQPHVGQHAAMAGIAEIMSQGADK